MKTVWNRLVFFYNSLDKAGTGGVKGGCLALYFLCDEWVRNVLRFITFFRMSEATLKSGVLTIPYHYKGNIYCVKVPCNKRKNGGGFISANEATRDIETAMGPFENFHSLETTPKMLGYKKIKINFFDENSDTMVSEKEFEENEKIEF